MLAGKFNLSMNFFISRCCSQKNIYYTLSLPILSDGGEKNLANNKLWRDYVPLFSYFLMYSSAPF